MHVPTAPRVGPGRWRALVVSIWHVLALGVEYVELGADHFDRRIDTAAHTHRLVRQLELLGHRVTLEPAA
jgi:hypothetical protein